MFFSVRTVLAKTLDGNGHKLHILLLFFCANVSHEKALIVRR